MIEFIVALRLLNRRPEQIVAFDKTSFYENSRYQMHIAPQGGYLFPIFLPGS